jgi:small subunit ribosomal protein S3
MGKKSHPTSLRMDFNGWNNVVWYTRDKKRYASMLHTDHKIRLFIVKFFEDGLISSESIERSGGNLVITLSTHRPGVVIGKQGAEIDKFKKAISKHLDTPVEVNVINISKPEIDASTISYFIRKKVAERGDYKKIIKNSIKYATKRDGDTFATGIKIRISGRLNGSSIARTEEFKSGSMPLHTFKTKIKLVVSHIKTIYGICGLKVYVATGSLGTSGGRRGFTAT